MPMLREPKEPDPWQCHTAADRTKFEAYRVSRK